MSLNLGPVLIKLIDSRVVRYNTDEVGTIVVPAYRFFDADLVQWLWVIDVDLTQDENRPDVANIIRAVPISDPSHEVHRATVGGKVRLHKTGNIKYEAVSLVNVVSGQVAVTTVIFTDVGVTINATVTFSSTYRKLTYDELGDPALNGGFAYGSLAYDTYGKFDGDDTLLFLITPRI